METRRANVILRGLKIYVTRDMRDKLVTNFLHMFSIYGKLLAGKTPEQLRKHLRDILQSK